MNRDMQAPQQGGAETPSDSGTRTPQMEAQQPPRVTPSPRGNGYAAAFGTGDGAAIVFRDLASI